MNRCYLGLEIFNYFGGFVGILTAAPRFMRRCSRGVGSNWRSTSKVKGRLGSAIILIRLIPVRVSTASPIPVTVWANRSMLGVVQEDRSSVVQEDRPSIYEVFCPR